MFQVGEYIVHPGQGVCKVADIEMGDNPVYKLLPMGMRHPMLISYPLSCEDKLRAVITSDEAEALIDDYADMELDTHVSRSRALEERHYRTVMKEGSCQDTIRIVKTLSKRIQDALDENKHPPVIYRRIFKEARDRSLEELSVALDKTPEQVEALLLVEEGK